MNTQAISFFTLVLERKADTQFQKYTFILYIGCLWRSHNLMLSGTSNDLLFNRICYNLMSDLSVFTVKQIAVIVQFSMRKCIWV